MVRVLNRVAETNQLKVNSVFCFVMLYTIAIPFHGITG